MAVKRYDGSAWQTVAGLGAQGAAATSSSIATWVKTASGGETSVSGNDDNSQPLSYTVGQELVFINGVLQKRGDDYTATTGNSITGLTALTAGDIVSVWTVNAFSVTNAISNTIMDAKGDLLTASSADVPARLAVGANDTVLTADSSTATGLKWATPSTPTYAGCRVFNTTDPSISNNTTTVLSFNSESFDTDNYHSTSSNTSRITIPTGKAGKYFINGKVEWYSNTSGYRSIYIVKNGTNFMSSSNISAQTIAFDQFISMTIDLAVGDYVELHVYHNSGGSLNVYGGSNYTHLEVNYLGA